jgi:hypothetical protein
MTLSINVRAKMIINEKYILQHVSKFECLKIYMHIFLVLLGF